MNIAIVCYHSMGGSGIIAYELGAAFAARGHQVHFVGLDRPFRMTGGEANMTFHRVEMRDYPVFVYPPYVLALASRLYEVVERYAIDVIHCHYAMPHALAGLLARDMSKRPVKVVTTLHGTDITLVGADPSFFSITKHAIERSDCVTAVSDFLRDRTAEVFGIDKARIRRIYNFVNPADFNPELPCGCPEGRNKRCGKTVLVHASNLREVKQPLDIIRVFRAVADATGDECRLRIVGDGPLRGAMEKLAADLGLAGRVMFTGATSRPGMYLACADIFLMTSHEESFGLAALEAMACRTAVVGYKSGGLPEVVEDGVSGLMTPYNDTAAMAAACIALMKDRPRLERMKDAALERARAKFTTEAAVEAYLGLCL